MQDEAAGGPTPPAPGSPGTPGAPGKIFYGLLLLGTLLLGAFLRLEGLGGPSLWLDEILNYDIAREAGELPWWSWLVGFEVENGPLYFAVVKAGQGLSEDPETAMRLGSALAGLLGLLAMAWAGTRLAGRPGMVAAVLLLAASPLHAVHSREGRTYALLMLWSLLLLAGMLEIHRHRGRLAVAVASLAAAYTAATAGPLLVAAGILGTGLMVLERRGEPGRADGPTAEGFVGRGGGWAAAWGLGGAALVALLHGRFLLERYGGTEAAAPFPHEGIAARWLRGFTVSALDVPGTPELTGPALALLVLALLGAGALLLRHRRAAWITIGLATLPAAVALAGLWLRDHWLSVRYLSPSLPAFLLLAAVGLTALGRLAGRAVERSPGARAEGGRYRTAAWARTLVPLAGAALLAWATFGAARTEPERKPDWRRTATLLSGLGHPGEAVLAANDWTAVCLRFYLPRVGGGNLRLREVRESVPMAARWSREEGTAWLVTAGHFDNREIVGWMSRFAPVVPSGLGGPRIFFFPDLAGLAATRRGAVDPAIFGAGSGEQVELSFGWADPLFLGSGWSRPEVSSDHPGPEQRSWRWAHGRRAELVLPRPQDLAAVVFTARPFTWPGAPPQEVEVLLDGRPLGRVVLEPGWGTYRLGVPEEARSGGEPRPGLSHLELRFARATAPRAVKEGSRDRRRLAAALDWLALVSRRASPEDLNPRPGGAPPAAPAPPPGPGPAAGRRWPP